MGKGRKIRVISPPRNDSIYHLVKVERFGLCFGDRQVISPPRNDNYPPIVIASVAKRNEAILSQPE